MRLTELTTSMRRPVSARITIRRSTAVMAVLFLGLGALWLGVKPSSASPSTATNRALNQVLNSLPPGGSITLTRPGPTATTTTTAAPPTTTTTTVVPASTTTTRPRSTTTKPPRGTTTTTAPSAGAGSPTTTVGGRSSTTSSTSSTTKGPSG